MKKILTDSQITVITNWVSLLKNGNLRQITNQLQEGPSCLAEKGDKDDQYGYCCLGVLCELARAEGIVTMVHGQYKSKKNKNDLSGGDLPRAVFEWAGFDTSAPKVLYKGKKYSVIELNDGHGLNFAQIGELVRKEYLT
jgi:hypothetical protein